MVLELLPHLRLKIISILISILILGLFVCVILVIVQMTKDFFFNHVLANQKIKIDRKKHILIIYSIAGCCYLIIFVWTILMTIASFQPYHLSNIEEITLQKIDEYSIETVHKSSYSAEYFLFMDADNNLLQIDEDDILEISGGTEFKLLVGEYKQDGISFYNRFNNSVTRYQIVCPDDIAAKLNEQLTQKENPYYVY